MSVGWDSLPLLPLRCVLSHLSLPDALEAMSVCRHWRNALLVYEGHRELLKMRTKRSTERNMFLARLFRKHVSRLHVYVDCTGQELDKFFNIVLPEFYDSVKLKEIIFIGPNFSHQLSLPPTKIKRIASESLIFKHFHGLNKIGMVGCEMDVANENDRYMHERIEYYSAPLSWPCPLSSADSVLSSSNVGHMVFSTIQHISVDYDQMSTESLDTLSHLPMFSQLSLTITDKPQPLHRIDWHRLALLYPNGLDVGVNIIGMHVRRFNEVMENVLVEGMTLVSLKVLFSKTIYTPLIAHVVHYYKTTLREFAWIDTPLSSYTRAHRIITHTRVERIDACNINPFILLCWRCVNLRRLVIHGYWIWQYDVLGFVRLRKTLQHLEISSIYDKQRRYVGDSRVPPAAVIRAIAHDPPCRLDQAFIQEVNKMTSFNWSPLPVIRAPRSGDRARVVLQEILSTVDIM